ncbi:hypothetical protein ADUPG1_012008, partial [Aduncisulcus paluster]
MDNFEVKVKNLVQNLPGSIEDIDQYRYDLREIRLDVSDTSMICNKVVTDFPSLMWDIVGQLSEDCLPKRMSAEELREYKFGSKRGEKYPKCPKNISGLIFMLIDLFLAHPYFRLPRHCLIEAVLNYYTEKIRKLVYENMGLSMKKEEEGTEGKSEDTEAAEKEVARLISKKHVFDAEMKVLFLCSIITAGLESFDTELVTRGDNRIDLVLNCIKKLTSGGFYYTRECISQYFRPLYEKFIVNTTFSAEINQTRLQLIQSFALYCLGAIDRWDLAQSKLISESFGLLCDEIDDAKDDHRRLNVNRIWSLLLVFVRTSYAVESFDDALQQIREPLGLPHQSLIVPTLEEEDSKVIRKALADKMKVLLEICHGLLAELVVQRRHKEQEIDILLGRRSMEEIEKEEEEILKIESERGSMAAHKYLAKKKHFELMQKKIARSAAGFAKSSEEMSETKLSPDLKEKFDAAVLSSNHMMASIKTLTDITRLVSPLAGIKKVFGQAHFVEKEEEEEEGEARDSSRKTHSTNGDSSTPCLLPSIILSTFHRDSPTARINEIWRTIHRQNERGWYLIVYEGVHHVLSFEEYFQRDRQRTTERRKRRFHSDETERREYSSYSNRGEG